MSGPSSSVLFARSIARVPRRYSERAPPARRLDDGDLQLGPPAELPQLVEGAALSGDGLGLGPLDLEQAQPVKEAAARAVGRLAQVEIERLDLVGPLEPEPPFLGLELAAERNGGSRGRDLAQGTAQLQPIAHERERPDLAAAQHRLHAVVDLAEARIGEASERSQRLCETDALDHAGGRSRQILLAQRSGRAHGPSKGRLFGMCPEVLVPARRVHAGAVAAPVRQSRRGPRDPGGDGLGLRETLQQICVGLRRAQLGEDRGVPGAADDGDPILALLDRGPDRLAHERLAARILGREGIGMLVAQRAHRLEQTVEQA